MVLLWQRYKYAALVVAVCSGLVAGLAFYQNGHSSAGAQPSAYPQASTSATGRVLYYGDSLAAESARYARANLGSKVSLVDRSYPGSSPCDWMSAARLDLSRGRPRAVVIETFGNNISPCQKVGGHKVPSGSLAYWAMYQKHINALVALFPSGTPIWLTAAPAAKNDRSGGGSHKARMLLVMKIVARFHRNVRVVDAGRAVESPAGRYSAFGPCLKGSPCSNQPRRGWTRYRAMDGLHFCPTIYWATVSKLRHCSVFATGAKKFGVAQSDPVKKYLGL